MAEKVYVVSVGLGQSEYLTPAAAKVVAVAKYLAGGERNLQLFNTENKELFIIRNNLSDLIEFIKKNIKFSPVILASGDAGFYGILNYVKKHFSPESIVVIPGISSMQMAFARLCDSWHDAVFFSIHGRPLEEILSIIKAKKITILTDGENTPQRLAGFLLNNNIKPSRVAVLHNLSYPDEFVWNGSLSEMAVIEKTLINSVVIIYNE